MEICGECQGEYSEQCGRKKTCQVHDAECWECRDCDQESSVEECSYCDRKYMQEDMFFCHQCNSYICIHQFQAPQRKDTETTQLKCGCTELSQHVLAFLWNFCTVCRRRMNRKKSLNLQKCKICNEGKNFKPKRKLMDQKSSSLSSSDSSSDSQWKTPQKSEYIKCPGRNNNFQSQSIEEDSKNEQWTPKGPKQTKKTMPRKSAMTLSSRKDPRSLIIVNTPKPPQKSNEIDQLKQKISQINQSYCVSQFTRMQFKKILLQEKEDNCLVCYLPYSLTRKPMMICLQQHLLCSFCIKDTKILECPLCRDPICRQKITVCKERTRALEIEVFLFQKIQNKKKWIEEYMKQAKSNTKILDDKSVEVQTQISVHNQTKRYPQRKRRQSRGRQPLANNRF